jgi:hypothetical protein
LKYGGKPKTLDELEDAIRQGVWSQWHDRSWYQCCCTSLNTRWWTIIQQKSQAISGTRYIYPRYSNPRNWMGIAFCLRFQTSWKLFGFCRCTSSSRKSELFCNIHLWQSVREQSKKTDRLWSSATLINDQFFTH